MKKTLRGHSTDRDAPIAYKNYTWNHSIAEVLNALIQQKCRILHFNEFSYSHFNCFDRLVQGDDKNWRVQGLEDKLPMMYSVKAIYAPERNHQPG